MKNVRSSSSRRCSRHRFWQHSFLGRVLGLAVSSGASGFFVGGLVGLANSQAGPSYHLGSGGVLVLDSWWQVVQFCAFANTLWMSILGFIVDLLVMSGVRLASSYWSISRKQRFAGALKTRFFLLVVSALIFLPVLMAMICSLRQQFFFVPPLDLGNVLEYTQMAALPLVSCLFALLCARSSKTKPARCQAPLRPERLLPLD